MKYNRRKIATVWYNLPRLFVRRPPFRLVFHHLPKCGGTSVHQAIRRCFPLDPRIEVRIAADASARTADQTGQTLFAVREGLLLYHMTLPRTAYISGHIPFSERVFQEYADQWSFITIIRHPVARWLSAYFDSRYPRVPGAYGSINMSLEEYLESPRGRAEGSACLSFFAGSTDGEPSVERALRTLRRFSVVGVLEELDAFASAFAARYGTSLKVPHFNRNPVSVHVQKQKVTPEIWRRVEEICRPDLELYDAVRAGVLQNCRTNGR